MFVDEKVITVMEKNIKEVTKYPPQALYTKKRRQRGNNISAAGAFYQKSVQEIEH